MSQREVWVPRARLLALGLTAVLFVACGNIRTAPKMVDTDSSGLQPKIEDKDAVVVGIARDFDVGRYKTVIVDRFTVPNPGIDVEEDKQLADIASGHLQGEFVRRLRESGLFETVVAPGDGPPITGTTLKLTGSIADIQGGSRHVRFWIGFAAGRSQVEIHTRLLDAETGKPVVVTAVRRLHALSEGSSPYGGSNEDLVKDALRDSAEDYVRFLARLARGQAPRAQFVTKTDTASNTPWSR